MKNNFEEEKRRCIRVDTFLKVVIKVHSINWEEIKHKVDGSVLNLSKDSFLIKTDRALSEGDRVSFLIYSKPRKIQYHIKGIVSQIRHDGTVIMITEVDPPEFIISDFVMESTQRHIDITDDLHRNVDIELKEGETN